MLVAYNGEWFTVALCFEKEHHKAMSVKNRKQDVENCIQKLQADVERLTHEASVLRFQGDSDGAEKLEREVRCKKARLSSVACIHERER